MKNGRSITGRNWKHWKNTSGNNLDKSGKIMKSRVLPACFPSLFCPSRPIPLALRLAVLPIRAASVDHRVGSAQLYNPGGRTGRSIFFYYLSICNLSISNPKQKYYTLMNGGIWINRVNGHTMALTRTVDERWKNNRSSGHARASTRTAA